MRTCAHLLVNVNDNSYLDSVLLPVLSIKSPILWFIITSLYITGLSQKNRGDEDILFYFNIQCDVNYEMKGLIPLSYLHNKS